MKINIISIYFPPEKGAASSRIFNLAYELKLRGAEITVITAFPNYPYGKIFDGYKGVLKKEEIDNIKIRRHWVFASNSKNPVLRIFSMLSFSIIIFISYFSLKKNRADITIVNSPPLLSGYFGALLGRIVSKRVVTNVSDIWPLSALELGAIKRGTFYTLLEFIERKMYNISDALISQSVETKNHISNLAPNKNVFLYRNIPRPNLFAGNFKRDERFRIIYAGLLGVAQGVLNIIKNINFQVIGAELHLYGDGNEKESILQYLRDNPNCNIIYNGMIEPNEIDKLMPTYDVSLIPLTSNIYGAFPSKIFAAISAGLPILFSGLGEGKSFVIENDLGLVNDPNKYCDLVNNIKQLMDLDKEEYVNYRFHILRKAKELCDYNLNNDYIYTSLKDIIND